MLFVIDVGNTNTVYGIYDGDTLLGTWRMTTQHSTTSDEIGLFFLKILEYEKIDPAKITATIISSVVPQVMYSLEHAIRKYLGHRPIVVDSNVDLGIRIKMPNPAEVGADRLVNAAAAHHLYSTGVIIIDFGTATTFCAVSSAGEYLGGVISPGVKISMEALYTNTAKLPRIEITRPEHIIGNGTIPAMQSGVLFSYVGGVEYIVRGMKKEMGESVKVIATGGLARMIAKETDVIDEVNPLLTLEGLRYLYHKITE